MLHSYLFGGNHDNANLIQLSKDSNLENKEAFLLELFADEIQLNMWKLFYKLFLIMIGEDFESEYYDTSFDKFKTYEEYLDSHITKEDLFYLEDIELARQLKEQGYHAKIEILSREQFH